MKKEDIIKDILNKLKEKINDPKIDTTSAFKIVSLAMEIIETYKTNENKKEIIIMTFKELIKTEGLLSDDISNILKPILENEMIISGIIDVICMATKGEININKIKIKKCSCFPK